MLINPERLRAYSSLLVAMTFLMTAAVPIVNASQPIPEITLASTVFDVAQPLMVRVRILTLLGVPNPESGLQLVFNTPSGIMTHNVETISTDTWYTVTVTEVTKAAGSYSVVAQLPAYNTNSKTLTFTVRQTQDFSLSTSPTSVNIKQGEKGSFSVSVGAVGGFDKSVVFTVSGLPDGATAVFSTSSGRVPFDSSVTLSISSSTREGNYPITIQGTGDNKVHTVRVTLIVDKMPTFLERISVPTLTTSPYLIAVIAIGAITIAFTAQKIMAQRRKPGSAEKNALPPPPPPPRNSMKYCINCGALMPEHSKYCSKCGDSQK